MKLIIAEKPSVAKEIAYCLGNASREDGYFTTGTGDLVTFAFGHLIQLAEPEEMNPSWKDWRAADLPLLPPQFKYKASESGAKQLKIILNLLKKQGVSEVVNACDAGREGEYIFWLIYNYAESRLPVKRCLISSLTREAISQSFRQLRPASDFEGLKQAGYLRAQADWLFGMNATRALTLQARTLGGNGVYSLGRVQTPVLKLIVDRDLAIENFISVPFYVLRGQFRQQNGAGGGEFFATHCQPNGETIRFDELGEAALLAEKLNRQPEAPFVKDVQTKTVEIKQPLLFDMTSLQRKLNRLSGFTAEETLAIAQSLYEKKHITYPRTSCNVISTTVYQNDVVQFLDNLAQSGESFSRAAQKIKNSGWKLGTRHVNDKKVGEHHAIVPTPDLPRGNLTGDEKMVYDIIAERLLAAFFPLGKDQQTVILIDYSTHLFAAKGTVIIEPGWRSIESEENPEETRADTGDETGDETERLPQLSPGNPLFCSSVETVKGETRPPSRHTDDSILGLMQTAGQLVEKGDEEAEEMMKQFGLGTDATRAEILETLIKRGYLTRNKKQLISTAKAREVIGKLSEADVSLVSPRITGIWEAELRKISNGEVSSDKFRSSLVPAVQKTVHQLLSLGGSFSASATADSGKKTMLGEESYPCPKCRSNSVEAPGSIKEITFGAKKEKALVCSLGKESCGYFSSLPKRKRDLKRLLTNFCICGSHYHYRVTKNGKEIFSCAKYPECQNTIWLEDEKSNTKSKN